jgi:hypothetical protein
VTAVPAGFRRDPFAPEVTIDRASLVTVPHPERVTTVTCPHCGDRVGAVWVTPGRVLLVEHVTPGTSDTCRAGHRDFPLTHKRPRTDTPGAPVRTLCNVHTTRPDDSCFRCKIAHDVTGWWEHDQGRCDQDICRHCAFEAGRIL